MSAPRAFRTALLALIPAIGIAACAGDPATGPAGPDYLAAAKPRKQEVTLSNLVVTPTTMAIGPNAAVYTVTITNGNMKGLTDVILQGYLLQTRLSDGQSVNQGAGGTTISCTANLGELPRHSTCQSGFSINTTGQTQFGALPEAGAATFHLELISGTGDVLDVADVGITLQ
jgi:hypothetical protein